MVSKQLKRDNTRALKWSTNSCKLDITSFELFAKLLKVYIRDLFNPTDE